MYKRQVDDNPEILDFLSKILSEEYFVISASCGEEAIQILEKNSIDLIIDVYKRQQYESPVLRPNPL